MKKTTLLLALLAATALAPAAHAEGLPTKPGSPVAATVAHTLAAPVPGRFHAGDSFRLMLESQRDGDAVLQFRTAQGKVVKQLPVHLDKGANLLQIQLGDLAPGAYLLELAGAGQRTAFTLNLR